MEDLLPIYFQTVVVIKKAEHLRMNYWKISFE